MKYTLSTLPFDQFIEIVDFLDFKAWLFLSLTNKYFYKISQKTQWVIIRECILRYFPTDIELFCNFGHLYDFKLFMQNKTHETIKTTCHKIWYQVLQKEVSLKKKWFWLLSQYIEENECWGFINNIFFSLKEPSLPLMKLRRENIGMHSKSCFQNKLCDVLYEGNSIKKSFILEDDALAFLKEEQDMFFQQFIDENKDQLKSYRWYCKESFEENKEDRPFFYNQALFKKQNFVFLMDFYDVLYETLLFQIEIIIQVLELQKNPLDLIFEYNTKWNIYVASLAEYENSFASFIEVFNLLYEKECNKYPSFPKFTIWRLMQKLWIFKIFTRFEKKLFLSFLIIIDYHRFLKLSRLLDANEPSSCSNTVEKYIDNLYQDHIASTLMKYDQNNFNKIENKADEFKYMNFTHEFFLSCEENYEYLISLASSFMQSVLDLSVNEISVHYLGHSKLETDQGFDKINDIFIEDSRQIYILAQKAFGSMIFAFKDFLEQDYKDLADNFNEKTVFSLHFEALKIWTYSYKDHFCMIFLQFVKEKNTEIIEESSEPADFSKFFDEDSGEFKNFSKEHHKILIDSLKDLLPENHKNKQEILHFLLNEEKNVLESLETFLKFILELYFMETEKPELDYEIEDINKYRKLPFPLEESEKYFYYSFRTITLPFLEDVYKKYLSNLATHEHDSSMSQDELDEYNQSENNDSLETYNEEEEELKLSKKTSEMILEDMPVLKKKESNRSQRNKNLRLSDLQKIDEDKNEEMRFFMMDSNHFNNNYKNIQPPKSVKSLRSNTSRKSKKSINSKESKSRKKMSDDLDDLDLPLLKFK